MTLDPSRAAATGRRTAEYLFTDEPRGHTYRELLDGLIEYSDQFGLVLRPDLARHEAPTETLLDRLSPWLLESSEVREWPGTLMVSSRTMTLCRFQSTSEAVELLKLGAEGLFDWVSPQRPEDLHFYAGAEVLLGNWRTNETRGSS